MHCKYLKMMAMVTSISVFTGMAAIAAEEVQQISPIIDQEGADPFVTRYGDKYLYTKTTGSNVCLAVADSVETLGAAELISVYEPISKLKDLWAPEIWHLDDTWYIYFAATVPGEEMHRMYVLSNPSEDPLEGEWECTELQGMDDKFAIDGTILELGENRYFLWSGWEGYENVRQDIYLAQMISPVEVQPEKILLSIPELDWEKNGDPLINEGPEVILRDDTVNLVYSASGSWTDDYCLGLLTMPVDGDPKDPNSWEKQEEPILSRSGDVYGPGHNSFTVSPDGSEDLIIYHAARWKNAGWDRNVRFGRVTFDENGKILPMDVTSGSDTIALPSGSKGAVSYPVDAFTMKEDSLSLTLVSEEEKEETLVFFVKLPKEPSRSAVFNLKISVNEESTTQTVFSCENYQPLYFRAHLKEGENEILIRTKFAGKTLDVSHMEIR